MTPINSSNFKHFSALERITAGEYGFCAVCGEDIDTKHLELDHSVLVCMDCAK